MVRRVSRLEERELWEGEDKSPAARERGKEGAVCREVGERGTGAAAASSPRREL